MKDGRISYLMKTPRRGSTHRVMTPMEFMGRLAILVPPPYYPLVRYHGVFGARSSWRRLVTPKPRDGVVRRKKAKACKEAEANAAAPSPSPSAAAPAPVASPSPAPASPSIVSKSPLAPLALGASVDVDDPTTITIKHWARILDGDLFASSSRVEWAVLLRRTFGFDALRCPKCDAKRRVLSTITAPDVAKKILSHLGMRTESLPLARARDPTGQADFDFDVA